MRTRDRVDAYRALFVQARAANRSPAEHWTPDISRARVRLGTSLADYAIPYAIHEDLQQAIDVALLELLFLYLRRHADQLGDAAEGILIEDPRKTPLRPPSYSAPDGVQSLALRQCLEGGPQVLPDLDTGILASWLGSGGSGRRLMAGWTRALHTCFDEMTRADSPEPTPLFFHWVMRRSLLDAVQRLQRKSIPAPVQERAQVALRVALHLLQRVMRQLLAEERPVDLEQNADIALAWDVFLNPHLDLAGTGTALQRCHFYAAPARALRDYEETLREALAGVASFDVFIRSVSDVLRREPGLRRAAGHAYAISQIRRNQIAVLAIGVPRTARLHQDVLGWLQDPARFTVLLADPRARAEMGKQLAPLARDATPPTEARRVGALAEFIAEYRMDDPLSTVATDRARAELQVAASLALDLADAHFARQAGQIQQRFKPLTGRETDRDLGQQYDSGRLYLFGTAPVLKGRRRRARVAHYFIDLKDYTRRTALLKEDVMADFIRERFYLPILAIAREYHHGLPEMEDRGGVHLNCLLGDAISLSGDVSALVFIARRIRRKLTEYAAQLSARESDQELVRRTDEVRARYRERLQLLCEQRAALESERTTVAGDTTAKQTQLNETSARQIGQLRHEEMRLERELELEIAQVTGAELSAGSFIAFGAPPTVLAFDDPAWGDQRVSISEKINESARGTDRSGEVRRAIDRELEMERRLAGNPALEPIFHVHVRRPLTLPLSAEVEQRTHEALEMGDLEAAEAALRDAAHQHVREISASNTASHPQLQGLNLYNAGDALSGEALNAYRKQSDLQHVEEIVAVDELEPELRGRYAFGSAPLRLIIGTDATGAIREIFRYAGALTFKGFEAAPPTSVWEMIDPEAEAGRALIGSERVRHAVAGKH
jgi:hypothetical protein